MLWIICTPIILAEVVIAWRFLNRHEKRIVAWLDALTERLRNF